MKALIIFSLLVLILKLTFAVNHFYSESYVVNDTSKNEYGEATIIKGLTFKPKTAELEATSQTALTQLLNLIKKEKELKVKISVYTDNQGDNAEMINLSKKRANVLRSYLVKNGIEVYRILVVGEGSANPVATNDTEDGRKQNNRVEMRKKIVNDGYSAPLVFDNVKFSNVSDTLFSSSYSAIQKFAKEMKRDPKMKIKIISHAFSEGSENYNMTLSINRALAVKNYLVKECYIDEKRIETEGLGDRYPLVANDSEQGKQSNSRVEVAFKR